MPINVIFARANFVPNSIVCVPDGSNCPLPTPYDPDGKRQEYGYEKTLSTDQAGTGPSGPKILNAESLGALDGTLGFPLSQKNTRLDKILDSVRDKANTTFPLFCGKRHQTCVIV